jgi:hypothetical protein
VSIKGRGLRGKERVIEFLPGIEVLHGHLLPDLTN